MRSLIRLIPVLSLIAFAPISSAQGKSPATMAEDLNNIVLSSCAGGVNNIINDPKLAPILAGRALGPHICECTKTRFKADTRLQEQFNIGLMALSEKMQSKKFEAYFTTRLMSAMFACIAVDLDNVLAEHDPAQ